MEHIGLNPERLRIEWCDASEGIRFAKIVNDFVGKVRGLGPLGQSEGTDQEELKSRLEEVAKLVPYIKVVKNEKLALRLDKVEDYNELYTTEEIDRLFSEIVSYYIDPDKCKACGICLRRCPVEAIAGGKNQIHVIDQEKCIKCGTCSEVCPPRFDAVKKILNEPVPPPIPEEARMIVR
jgi:ferredoxin